MLQSNHLSGGSSCVFFVFCLYRNSHHPNLGYRLLFKFDRYHRKNKVWKSLYKKYFLVYAIICVHYNHIYFYSYRLSALILIFYCLELDWFFLYVTSNFIDQIPTNSSCSLFSITPGSWQAKCLNGIFSFFFLFFNTNADSFQFIPFLFF